MWLLQFLSDILFQILYIYIYIFTNRVVVPRDYLQIE